MLTRFLPAAVVTPLHHSAKAQHRGMYPIRLHLDEVLTLFSLNLTPRRLPEYGWRRADASLKAVALAACWPEPY